MEFLAAVGAFALIVLAGYLVLRNLDNKSSQAEANRQLVEKVENYLNLKDFANHTQSYHISKHC